MYPSATPPPDLRLAFYKMRVWQLRSVRVNDLLTDPYRPSPTPNVRSLKQKNIMIDSTSDTSQNAQKSLAGPRRRLAPAERREQLLVCARKLVEKNGFQALSLNDVAKAAGVARALAYHYFPNRRELIDALLMLEYRTFQEILTPPDDLSMEEQFEFLQHRLSETFFSEKPRLTLQIFDAQDFQDISTGAFEKHLNSAVALYTRVLKLDSEPMVRIVIGAYFKFARAYMQGIVAKHSTTALRKERLDRAQIYLRDQFLSAVTRIPDEDLKPESLELIRFWRDYAMRIYGKAVPVPESAD